MLLLFPYIGVLMIHGSTALADAAQSLLGAERDTWRDDTILSALGARELLDATRDIQATSESVSDNSQRLREGYEKAEKLREQVSAILEEAEKTQHPSRWKKLWGARELSLAEALAPHQEKLQELLRESKTLRVDLYVAQDCLAAYEPILLESVMELTTVLDAASRLAQRVSPELQRDAQYRVQVLGEHLLVAQQSLAGLRTLSENRSMLDEYDAFLINLTKLSGTQSSREQVEAAVQALARKAAEG